MPMCCLILVGVGAVRNSSLKSLLFGPGHTLVTPKSQTHDLWGAVQSIPTYFTLDVGVLMIGCIDITHVLYRIAFSMPIEASMGS